MLIVVSYDVTDDKRRENVANELRNYGKRVQKSIFECYLNEYQKTKLKQKLEKLIDLNTDSIRYYSLCKKDENNIHNIGSKIIYKDDDYFMF